ncbi:MAG: hypothetical protein LBI57_07000 [Helicobacteraceae bacterium]|jgi:hypothetical protein|nr:hypothetical protein [Helicobacteraceae bacterium]
MRLKHIAAAIILPLCVNLFAAETLVAPADRDRLIKTRDGRQIRLNAGSELIRTDDGRLAVRRALDAQEQSGRETARAAIVGDGGDRWVWFVGLEGATSSIARDYKIDTNEINKSATEYETISYENKLFKTDGGAHKFSTDKNRAAFAVVGGVKDEREQNYYQLGYYASDKLDEIAFSAQFGFTSLALYDNRIVPYARLVAAAGFEDGVGSLDADSFAFGGGIGATYIVNSNIEIYGGAEYLSRNFGSSSGKASKPGGGSIAYGSVEREEKETRAYIGARYLLR